MGPRRYLLLMVLLAEATQASPKDLPVVPPPMAQPQSVSVFRGGSIDIPLKAQGRTPGQLKFLIRSLPNKGRLGELRVTGPKSAEVTYAHDGNSEGSDSFTFAVQAVDSPVSAAAAISLSISEEPPRLAVPEALHFGAIEVGSSREEHVALRNSGGGVLEGTVEVSLPWKVMGPTKYRLGRNQQSKVRILCAPDEPQEYAGKLVFSHDARTAVALTATGISPFTFEPSGGLELSSDPAGPWRSGVVVVRNESGQDRTLQITAPPEVAAPDQIFVAAGAEQKISLRTEPDFLGDLEGTIIFESEGFKQGLPVRVDAVQPMLRIEPREGLDFGQVEPRRQYKGFLRIKNEGGSPAHLRARVPPEILLVPDPGSAVIRPGETRVFEVIFEASSTGEHQSEIVIESGAGRSVSVGVVGLISNQPAQTQKVPRAALRSVASATPPSQRSSSSVPGVKEIKVLKASDQVFEFGWKKPVSGPVAWIIQQRHLEASDTAPPKAVWRDLSNVKFFEQNDFIGARFENLAPGQVWFLRVLSIDQQGRRSAPSPTFMMSSEPVREQPLLRGTLVLLAVGAGVFGWIKFRRRKRAEASAQAEQIARIDR